MQLSDATEFAAFSDFQTSFAEKAFQSRWDAEAGVYHVAYDSGDALLEAGFNPTATLKQPTTQAFPYRRFGGDWPYLAPGVSRDTTTAIQSESGVLSKGGATLTVREGIMAYLQAFPEEDSYVAMNPYLQPVPFRFEVPGGIVIATDAPLGQARVEVQPRRKRVDISYAGADNPGAAKSLHISGFATRPVVTLNGEPATCTADDGGFRVALD